MNLYFHSGVSKNPKILLDGIDKQSGNALMDIRQPFTFELLGLDARSIFGKRTWKIPCSPFGRVPVGIRQRLLF